MGDRQPDPEEGMVKYGDVPPDTLRGAIARGADLAPKPVTSNPVLDGMIDVRPARPQAPEGDV